MPQPSKPHIHFRCHCGQKIAVPGRWAGKRAKCPKCQTPLSVPIQESFVQQERASTGSFEDDIFPSLSEGEPVFRLAPEASKPAAPAPTLAPENGKSCPGCGKVWAQSAKICVNCGIDLKTGRAIQMRDDGHLDRIYETTESLVTTLSWIIPFGLYPVASEAFGFRTPWVVRSVALLIIAVSVWYFFAVI